MALLQLLLLTAIIYIPSAQDCDNNTPGTLCVINGANAGSTITCRDNDPCEISCSGSESCGDDTIQATDATHVTITCAGTDACKGNTKIYCGTGDCILHCLNSETSCQDATIYNLNGRAHSYQCDGYCSTNADSGDDTTYTQIPTISPNTQTLTVSPSKNPSTSPSNIPSQSPSNNPSQSPSNNPSKSPSNTPTESPSKAPSKNPSKIPTISPTQIPTAAPLHPSVTQSHVPSNMPVMAPTKIPSVFPSVSPTKDVRDDGGEVNVVETTYGEYGGEESEKQESDAFNGVWLYIVAVCGVICCCIGLVLIGCKVRNDRNKKVSQSVEDSYRMNVNQEMQTDFWSNPIHKQVVSLSGVEGDIMSTQLNGSAVNSNDVHCILDESISSDSEAVTLSNGDGTGTGTVEMGDLHNYKTKGIGDDEFEVVAVDDMCTPNGDEENALHMDVVGDIVEDIGNMVTVGYGDGDIDGDANEDYDCYTDDDDDDDVIGSDLAHEMLTLGGDENDFMDEEDDNL